MIGSGIFSLPWSWGSHGGDVASQGSVQGLEERVGLSLIAELSLEVIIIQIPHHPTSESVVLDPLDLCTRQRFL